MYTRSTPKAEAIANRKWFVVDLEGETLGRAAARIAHILLGKHKPTYTPHIDDGDYVVVVNAAKVRFTGNKLADKMYYRHSTYVGGLKETTAGDLMAKKPEDVVRKAVKGMLGHGPLGRAQLKKLKIYAGPEHEQAAQQPETLDLSTVLARSQA
jgi:large subunit ribosomal protein L13